jgi:hypothetical protein
VRPEDVAGELVADRDVVEQALVVSELLDLVDVTDLDLLELGELVVGPLGLTVTALGAVTGEELLLLCVTDLVADRGRPLLGDPLTPLVDVDRVAPLEAGRSGELGIADLVVVRHAVADKMVTGDDAGTEEPPLVAAEDEVGFRDLPDLGRRAAVARVCCDCERLRGDNLAEPAGRREHLVVMQGVRIVHALDPAADVVQSDRVLQLARHHRHAHVMLEIGDVELVVDAVAHPRRSSTIVSNSASRTLVSLAVIGISPSSKNKTRFGTL